MASNAYSVLTGRVQDALAEEGASLISDGIWSKRTCAGWWLVMEEAPTESGVRELLGDYVPTQCKSISVPACPRPSAAELAAVKVAKPGWQADIGGKPWNLWLVGGVVAVAAALAYTRRNK
jgi:hypothetical protein